MDYLELLFAAQVRDLAASRHAQDRSENYRAIKDQFDADSISIEQEKWVEAHPVSAYVPAALAEIKAAAEQIKNLA
jgi:hypothetical protein